MMELEQFIRDDLSKIFAASWEDWWERLDAAGYVLHASHWTEESFTVRTSDIQ